MIAQNRAPPYRSSRTGNANSGTRRSVVRGQWLVVSGQWLVVSGQWFLCGRGKVFMAILYGSFAAERCFLRTETGGLAWLVNGWRGNRKGKRLAGSAVSAGGAAVLCRRTRSEFGTSSFSKQSGAIAEEALIFQKTDARKADGGREMTLTDEKTER